LAIYYANSKLVIVPIYRLKNQYLVKPTDLNLLIEKPKKIRAVIVINYCPFLFAIKG
jgi:hypothetical protein